MTLLLVLTTVVLACYCGWLHWRLRNLAVDLRYVHKAWRAGSESQGRVLEELRRELAEARAATAAPEPGGSWFTPYMTIQDALNVHPGVADVMKSLHIGGCSSCSVSAKETLEQAASGHGVDLKLMLSRLNALMQDREKSAALADGLPPTEGGRVMLAVGSVPARSAGGS